MKSMGRFFGGLLTVALMAFTLQSSAAETQQIGRDFKHMTTGFPLTGGHAAAACETCHVGGVFKGTPRACDGCHALGKRVVATPKPNSHIVTDAPCESCHFNTATWLGARYNHGSAMPGQCRNCHNGRIAAGKAASHGAGKKTTDSCDSCHRTFAWLPASWNHNLSPGVCSTCHTNASLVSGPNLKPGSHAPTALKGTLACDSCHNYTAWFPNRFKHNTGGTCSSCHNGTLAIGKHTGHIATIDECNQCHYGTTSFSNALGAKPATHIPYTAGTSCTTCHTSVSSVRTGAALHAYLTGSTCTICHKNGTAYPNNGQRTENLHELDRNPGATDCSSNGCHLPGGSNTINGKTYNPKGSLYTNWD